MSRIMRWLMAGLVLVVLSGCGGGGVPSEGDNGTMVSGAYKGIFLDAKVSGVTYETSSGVVGVTSENGEYAYNSGDTVKFYIGGVELGEANAEAIVSIFDLNNPKEVALLLQTLDDDGIPDNGIQISKDTREKFESATFTIEDVDSKSKTFSEIFGSTSEKALLDENDRIEKHAFDSLRKIVIDAVDPEFVPFFNPKYHDYPNFLGSGLNPAQRLASTKAKLRFYYLGSLVDKLIDIDIDTKQSIIENKEKTKEHVVAQIEHATDVWTQALGIISLASATKALQKELISLKKFITLKNGTKIFIPGHHKALDALLKKSLETMTTSLGFELFHNTFMDENLAKATDCIGNTDAFGYLKCTARAIGEISANANTIWYDIDQFKLSRKMYSQLVAKKYLTLYYAFDEIGHPNSLFDALKSIAKKENYALDIKVGFEKNKEEFEKVLDMLMTLYGPKGTTVYDYNLDEAMSLIATYQNIVEKLINGFDDSQLKAIAEFDNQYLSIEETVVPEESNQYRVCIDVKNTSRVPLESINGRLTYFVDGKKVGERAVTIDKLDTFNSLGDICSEPFDVSSHTSLLSQGIVKVSYSLEYLPIGYGQTIKKQTGNKYFEIMRPGFIDAIAKPIIKIKSPYNVYANQVISVSASGTTSLNIYDRFDFFWKIVSGNVKLKGQNDSTISFVAPVVSSNHRYELVTLDLVVKSLVNGSSAHKSVTIKILPKEENIPPADKEKPAISIAGGNPIEIKVGEKYIEYGATVSDNVDTDINVLIDQNINTSRVGRYTVVYTAEDKAGNKAIAKRIVNVVREKIENTKAISIPTTTAPKDSCRSFWNTGCEAVVEAGKSYTKTWTFANVGSVDLTDVRAVAETPDTKSTIKVIDPMTSSIAQGAKGSITMEISIPADAAPGVYKGRYKLVDDNGDINYANTGGASYFWYMFRVEGDLPSVSLADVTHDSQTYTFVANLSEDLDEKYTLKLSLGDDQGGWLDPQGMQTHSKKQFALALNITDPGTHQYRVAIYEDDARVSDWVEGSYTVASTTDIPTGVSVSSSSSGITLSWNAVDGASSYTVMRSLDGTLDGDYETIPNVSTTSYSWDKSKLHDGEIIYLSVAVAGGEQSDKVSTIWEETGGGASIPTEEDVRDALIGRTLYVVVGNIEEHNATCGLDGNYVIVLEHHFGENTWSMYPELLDDSGRNILNSDYQVVGEDGTICLWMESVRDLPFTIEKNMAKLKFSNDMFQDWSVVKTTTASVTFTDDNNDSFSLYYALSDAKNHPYESGIDDWSQENDDEGTAPTEAEVRNALVNKVLYRAKSCDGTTYTQRIDIGQNTLDFDNGAGVESIEGATYTISGNTVNVEDGAKVVRVTQIADSFVSMKDLGATEAETWYYRESDARAHPEICESGK